MIVPEFINHGPSLWHVLATQISAAQTPGLNTCIKRQTK